MVFGGIRGYSGPRNHYVFHSELGTNYSLYNIKERGEGVGREAWAGISTPKRTAKIKVLEFYGRGAALALALTDGHTCAQMRARAHAHM